MAVNGGSDAGLELHRVRGQTRRLRQVGHTQDDIGRTAMPRPMLERGSPATAVSIASAPARRVRHVLATAGCRGLGPGLDGCWMLAHVKCWCWARCGSGPGLVTSTPSDMVVGRLGIPAGRGQRWQEGAWPRAQWADWRHWSMAAAKARAVVRVVSGRVSEVHLCAVDVTMPHRAAHESGNKKTTRQLLLCGAAGPLHVLFE